MRSRLLFGIIGFLLISCGTDLDLLENFQDSVTIKLLFPEKDARITEGTLVSDTQSELVFRWTDESENAPYTVHLINRSSLQMEAFESDSTELSIIIDRNVSYSWYVSGASNTTSETWSFYNAGPGLESSIPLPATALSPSSGAAISQTSTTVNLSWRSEDYDDDIVGYDVYFGEAEDPPLYQSDVVENRLNDIPVSAGKTYYWKIVTKDSVGNESTSQIFVFTVG